jgi:hypothetical protein
MADRCQATAASGNPCSAKPRPGRPFCLWHDPEAEQLRREISRKGGEARSNAARIKKALPDQALTPIELMGVMSQALRDVLRGALDPGRANAAAALGRTLVSIREATETADRLAALEQAAGLGERRRA